LCFSLTMKAAKLSIPLLVRDKFLRRYAGSDLWKHTLWLNDAEPLCT
jgi:hypothetical protein